MSKKEELTQEILEECAKSLVKEGGMPPTYNENGERTYVAFFIGTEKEYQELLKRLEELE